MPTLIWVPAGLLAELAAGRVRFPGIDVPPHEGSHVVSFCGGPPMRPVSADLTDPYGRREWAGRTAHRQTARRRLARSVQLSAPRRRGRRLRCGVQPQPRVDCRVHAGRRLRPGLGLPLVWAHHRLVALFAPGARPVGSPSPTGRVGRLGWRTGRPGPSRRPRGCPRTAHPHPGGRGATGTLRTGHTRAAPGACLRRDRRGSANGSPPRMSSAHSATPSNTSRPCPAAGPAARCLGWSTERRMTEVRRLLRETNLSFDAVAARTRLRDATYLVRRFRARDGVTPQGRRRAMTTAGGSHSATP